MSKQQAKPRGIEIQHVRPSLLKRAGYNPRSMTDKAREALKRGIARYGLVDPIIARRRDKLVVGGHQRLDAAKELGLATVPVVFLDDLDDQHAAALNVLLNNPSAQGEWDFGKLSAVLSELDGHGFDATLTGFDDAELERLLSWTPDPEKAGEEDESVDLTPPKKPKSKRGEIYQLGRHRLMCGDATSEADVAKLMGGGLADMVWTDPPYGVEYVGGTKDALTIENDRPEGLDDLLRLAFAGVDSALKPGGRVYCAAPGGPRNLSFRVAFVETGWRLHQELVWVKSAMVLGHADYHYRHEPILYGHKVGPGRVGRGKHAGTRWYGDHSQTSVFEFDKPSRSAEHPTMKPVGLVRAQIGNSSKPRDKVLDTFAGSGTTLIACEQTGRTAYVMEIDPRYCDVIRKRYAALVGDVSEVA